MSGRSGFTLIELVISLAVVIIVSGVLLIRITAWSPNQALLASARSVGNVLRTVREQARHQETSLTVTLQDREYRVFTPSSELVRRGSLNAGEAFEPPQVLVFGPSGVLPEKRVTIRGASDRRVTLILGQLLNEIEYQEQN